MKTEKLKIIGVTGKIQTEHLLDTSQKHHSLIQLANYCATWNSLVVLLQVTQLEDFFGSEDVFFAYGNERYSRDDFDLDVEGKESYILMQ